VAARAITHRGRGMTWGILVVRRQGLEPRTVASRELSGRSPHLHRPTGRGSLAGGSFTAVVPCCPGVAHRLRANGGPLRGAHDQRCLGTVG
jgi:hypothetical protein